MTFDGLTMNGVQMCLLRSYQMESINVDEMNAKNLPGSCFSVNFPVMACYKPELSGCFMVNLVIIHAFLVPFDLQFI